MEGVGSAHPRTLGYLPRVRRFRRSVVLIAVGLVAGLAPAAAQFGGIFGDPPRPPGNVPSRPPADDRFIDQRGPGARQYPQYPPPAPARRPPPPPRGQPNRRAPPPKYQPPAAPQAAAAAATPGGIQSQSLPP